MGLVNQVIERAPRWLIRKLTSTYVTLGLGDIAKEIGSSNEDEVRATIVSMVSTIPADFLISSGRRYHCIIANMITQWVLTNNRSKRAR